MPLHTQCAKVYTLHQHHALSDDYNKFKPCNLEADLEIPFVDATSRARPMKATAHGIKICSVVSFYRPMFFLLLLLLILCKQARFMAGQRDVVAVVHSNFIPSPRIFVQNIQLRSQL
jgi:hypothetical protein